MQGDPRQKRGEVSAEPFLTRLRFRTFSTRRTLKRAANEEQDQREPRKHVSEGFKAHVPGALSLSLLPPQGPKEKGGNLLDAAFSPRSHLSSSAVERTEKPSVSFDPRSFLTPLLLVMPVRLVAGMLGGCREAPSCRRYSSSLARLSCVSDVVGLYSRKHK